MIKLNDDNIFVGEIKQILHTFNLPTCNIGEENKQVNKHYITTDSNEIYFYKQDSSTGVVTSVRCDNYIYGRNYRNLTSRLKLENNIYDIYTHRYLGKYLRFIRDYHKLNLMSMYNLFDGEEIYKDITLESDDGTTEFSTTNKSFISYQIPITKSIYTVMIKSNIPIEMTVTFDDILSNQSEKLESFNYGCYKTIKSVKPVTVDISSMIDSVYTSVAINKSEGEKFTKIDTDLKKFYEDNMNKMYLVVKVPVTAKGKVVVLEGDYTRDCNNTGKGFLYYPETEGEGYDKGINYSDYYTKPQLLSYQNNGNYLLADKLIEFLTGSAISQMSEYYDIRKIQAFFKKHNYLPFEYFGVWSYNETASVKKYCGDKKLYNNYDMIGAVDGLIETRMNKDCNDSGEEGII